MNKMLLKIQCSIKELTKFLCLTIMLINVSCAKILPDELFIAENIINTKAQEKFPINKNFMSIYKVALSEPKIKLNPKSKQIQLDLLSKVSTPFAQPLSGKLSLSSGLKLDAKKQHIVLDNPSIDNIDFPKIDEDIKKVMLPALQMVLGELLNEYEVYKIKEEDVKLFGVNLKAENILIKENGIALKFEK